jgi:predicted Rossmann fold nucleotide-binding protein DprA/Smf involved in DNA uptake
MSEYGKRVIIEIMKVLVDFEVSTIKVSGCNSFIIENGAKVIFENKENFEQVNERLAEYADCLVIIEGGKRSGTLLLAQKFVEKNKRVLVVPGRIVDEGSFAPNWLAMQGAEMILDVNDLTEVLQ